MNHATKIKARKLETELRSQRTIGKTQNLGLRTSGNFIQRTFLPLTISAYHPMEYKLEPYPQIVSLALQSLIRQIKMNYWNG